jgi:hypothetical protein
MTPKLGNFLKDHPDQQIRQLKMKYLALTIDGERLEVAIKEG